MKPSISSSPQRSSIPFSRLTDMDLFLFNEGNHSRLYEKLGAHPFKGKEASGSHFAVWAPDAEKVSVVGGFNHWDPKTHPLQPRGNSGIWEGFVPGAKQGDLYKYRLQSRYRGKILEKADPFAFHAELPPRTASVVWDLDYSWDDGEWVKQRSKANHLDAPMAVYEIHLGSWGGESAHYREVAPRLAAYVKEMGFTHVEFLPLMEHPFYGSWGYQVTGYFAATSRYGSPQDLMYLIDYLHQQDIGVILDWVPSHFPNDPHSLAFFDGTYLYEHADPKRGLHPDWDSAIFNYGRNEVRSFLLSSAFFWLDRFHADGLRMDAVASMLYLDYSRKEGEWVPNPYGGREDLDAVEFLRQLNREIYGAFPDVQTIAEESTSWPMVSRPTYVGGLGFGLKWDMGWMNDTLRFLGRDPVHRKYHWNDLTFRQLYAHTENFLLPLSHDEVVHGKGSLLSKMPGDDWQKFANLRILLGYQYAQPGKKLLFMGGEFGVRDEWWHDTSLQWQLLDYAPHRGVQQWVKDLNRAYRTEPALQWADCHPEGFEWVDCHDSDSSVLSFLRKDVSGENHILVLVNFTPIPRIDYRVGVPLAGLWTEILNSDAEIYGGSGWGNLGGAWSQTGERHQRPHHLIIQIPPLGILFFKRSPEK
jgi:1,4-alpha-glucan branching enzyme